MKHTKEDITFAEKFMEEYKVTELYKPHLLMLIE